MALTVIFHISLWWNTPLTLNVHSSIWYYYVHTTIKTTFPSIIPLHVPSSPVCMCLLWFFKKHSSVDSHPWKFPFIPRTPKLLRSSKNIWHPLLPFLDSVLYGFRTPCQDVGRRSWHYQIDDPFWREMIGLYNTTRALWQKIPYFSVAFRYILRVWP